MLPFNRKEVDRAGIEPATHGFSDVKKHTMALSFTPLNPVKAYS